MTTAAGGSHELIELEDRALVAEHTAALLLKELLGAPQRSLQQSLGLATGRTMEPVYGALARRVAQLPPPERARLRRNWFSFNLDEYVGLGPADPRSFAAFMAERVAAPLGLDPATLQLPDGLASDPAAAAASYAAAVATAGGLGLLLLGLGLNGHVGFNEPPCGPGASCRCVTLSATTRRQNAAAFGGDPRAVPEHAITLGLREILAARKVVLVVTGATKAKVLRQALEGPLTPELPASWLQRHPALTVIADGRALGRTT